MKFDTEGLELLIAFWLIGMLAFCALQPEAEHKYAPVWPYFYYKEMTCP